MEKVNTVHRRAVRLNVGLQIVAALALLLAVNFFAFNHYGRWDFSRSQKFVLAEQTKRVIRELVKPVKITVFFSNTSASPEVQVYPDVQNLLKELIFSGRKKIEVEYVNPTRDLSRARELQGKYQFSASENVLILDYNGRVKFIPVADMADFDMSEVATGGDPRLIDFRGEQAVTNGLISLVSPEKLNVYFLQGHGEPQILGITPLSLFKDYIERQNVHVAPLTFNSTDSVPADCAALVIVAPQYDIDEHEAAILEHYWKKNGRLLVLLDPRALEPRHTPRLDALLATMGITPVDDRILRIFHVPLQPTLILRDVKAAFLPGNPITKRLAGANIMFEGGTQSLNFNERKSQADGVQIWPLIQAGEEYWGETEYVTDENKGVKYDDGKDFGSPLYVAAAAARGGVNDERVEVETSKLVVVGSSQFAFDAGLNQQQALDFLMSSMNWLLENRGQFTGPVPKNIQQFPLNLSDEQLSKSAFYTMIVMPGVAALIGLFVWWRRRR